MKLKKIILSFTIIILIFQYGFQIICNATEEQKESVDLDNQLENIEITNINQTDNIEQINDNKIENIDLINNNSQIENIEQTINNNQIENDENINNTVNDELKIYSEAAILIEATTGEILYEKDIYSRKYPASTTKILTAIIALEKCDLNEIAIASENAIMQIKSGYSIADIQVGESFSIGQLIDVMMIHSANEAANIIAEHISGSIEEFSKLMNQKAKEIGCLDSNFVNANGAHNDNHYSTAYDLAMIAKYCMKNEKFREIVTKMECELPITDIWDKERKFKNTNSLMLPENRYYYPYCNGIKTGFTTPAKNCLISSSNKDGFEVISVILHAEATEDGLSARYFDTINLFEYGYSNYKLEEILEKYDLINSSEEKNDTAGTFYEQNDILPGSEEQSKIGIVTDSIKKEYNTSENKILFKEWIKIFTGIIILFFVKTYLLKKKEVENKDNVKKPKEGLYNFKLNME